MICPDCGYDNLPGNEHCVRCHHDLTPYDVPKPNAIEACLMRDRVGTLSPRPLTTIREGTTIREAITRMLADNVGALLVVDDAGRLVGIFSERDLLTRVAGIHAEYADLPVGPFMTRRPETVAPCDPLSYVLHKMDGGGYRHLPVIDTGRPVGVLSVRDMLRHITRFCKSDKE